MNFFCIGTVVQTVTYKKLAMANVLTLLEYTIVRSFTMILLSLFFLLSHGDDPMQALPSDTRFSVYARAWFGLFVSVLINQALELAPYSILFILAQTAPFWTSILSYFLNGEPIFPIELLGMSICFVSVVFIARAYDEKDAPSPVNANPDDLTQSHRALGMFLCILATLLGAGMSVLTRKLVQMPAAIVILYAGVVGFLASVVVYAGNALVFDSYSDSELAKLNMTVEQMLVLAFCVFIDAIASL